MLSLAVPFCQERTISNSCHLEIEGFGGGNSAVEVEENECNYVMKGTVMEGVTRGGYS